MTFQEFIAILKARAKNTSEQGRLFEKFVKDYLTKSKIYGSAFETIWLWNEFPYNNNKHDTGIDLVAKKQNSDEFVAIQCKCFDESSTIYKTHIDSFISDSGKSFNAGEENIFYSQRLIVTTSAHWGKNAEAAIENQQIPVSLFDFNDFLKDEDIDWTEFSKNNGSLYLHHEPKRLRPHQEEAISAVIKGFETADRGKLIMACGTGKTFTSLKLAEKYAGAGKSVLFLAPSISLISQTIKEWLKETNLKIGCIPVCSDSNVGRKELEDDVSDAIAELIFPASTDADKFSERYNNLCGDVMKVVFSTYQSIEVVKEGQDRCGFEFDLIICDEAHRTTGVTLSDDDKSSFVKIHDADYIKGRKRLYMTATPRVYGEALKTKAKDNDAILCSMDDETIFGPDLYRLGFGKAVEKDLLSDYKVMILTVGKGYVRRNFQSQITNIDELDNYGKIIGVWTALSKRNIIDTSDYIDTFDPEPMKKAVAFAGTIKASKYFKENVTSLQNDFDYKNENLIPLTVDHVDGGMNSLIRNKKLAGLKEDNDENVCKILSNARCLSEGVDVPSLDAVIFLSPRNSMVDIVQSVGRVMRKSDGKKYGYIILPVVVPDDIAPEEALADNTKYKIIWDVLQALRSHDERFNHTINTLEFNKTATAISGTIGNKINVIQIGDDGYGGVQFTQGKLDLDIGCHNWADVLYSKIVEKCGDKYYWENWAKDVADIAKFNTEIINRILSEDKNAQIAFASFVKNLRNNLNEDITENDSVEMLSQHLITKPVFEALFSDYSFVKNNPVSLAMQEMLNALDEEKLGKGLEKLTKFYESVKKRTDGVNSAEGKQKIIIELYDKFFRLAFKDVTEKLGIVYTPVEPVDFIIRSVGYVLKEKFGKTLSDKGVHIIDPFTGTGTFIVRLLQSGLIKKEDLEYKYKNEIHANEIILLAYYIAAINIEETYHSLMGNSEYESFEGIVLTDTFNLAETHKTLADIADKAFLEENSSRLAKQKNCPIKVIIGNPPYSVGQKNQNDNNANTKYPKLEKSIADTYAKYSTATLKNSLYDSYIKAFRWASNRIENEGIICFITNGGFIDNQAMSGFRKCLSEEFSDIYCFNLRGDQRTQGEQSRKEGGKIFGSGSRASIAITLLVKEQSHKGLADIHYHDIGDYLKREEKLRIIADSCIEEIEWKKIIPDKNNDWINYRDAGFENFLPIGDKKDKNTKSIFNLYSSGIATSRDAWSYNFSQTNLQNNIINMINNYNHELSLYESSAITENQITNDKRKIKWTDTLIEILFLKQRQRLTYKANNTVISSYRPFCKEHLYYSKKLIHRTYKMLNIFPTPKHSNLLICVNGVGSNKDFMPLITDTPPCLDFCEKTQAFPLYRYIKYETENPIEAMSEDIDEYGYKKEYAISDYALGEFCRRYVGGGRRPTHNDIFYYIYGILHNKEYQTRYANDLKKSLPRIPFVKSIDDFYSYVQAGIALADLHLNYETLEPYKITETLSSNPNYKVLKMKLDKKDKSRIIFNSSISFSDIPLKAYDYIVNGRSPVEWVIERYQVSTDKESGIINDPNGYSTDEKYIYNLVKRLITLSLETLKIIENLPKFDVEM